MEIEVTDIDANFEPQMRSRSNTWPLRPREFTKEEENRSTPSSTEGELPVEPPKPDPLGLAKKTSSRRNAWGNLSYADLITKAIESSPEKRLTLSQIYDWMVQNVPYFKDKGESNSSAGWKNSIRHNLSLHSRFMRVQNEGTGKSSWWVINPDAKPGKTPRRRATSMDTKAYEKKRGRVKKKVEQLRAELHSQSNPGSEFGDSATELNLPDNFNLSPQGFRARTSSNASSIGGRLSPIQAGIEPDLDSQVSSPVPWCVPAGGLSQPTSGYTSQDGFTETLSQSLQEMFVHELPNISPDSTIADLNAMATSASSPHNNQSQISPSFQQQQQQQQQQQTFLPAPPPYTDQLRSSPEQLGSPQSHLLNVSSSANSTAVNGNVMSSLASRMNSQGRNVRPLAQSLSDLLRDSPPPPPANSTAEFVGNGLQDAELLPSNCNNQFTTLASASFTNQQQQQQSSPQLRISQNSTLQQLLSQHVASQQSSSRQQSVIGLSNSLLRQALTQKAQLQLATQLQQQQQQQQQQTQRNMQFGLQELLQQTPPVQQQQQQQQQPQQQQRLSLQQNQNLQQHLMSGGSVVQNPNANNAAFGPPNMPTDLLNFTDSKPSDLECDVDQIIKHELSMDGTLDFNFDATPTSESQQSATSQYNTVLT